MNFRQITDELLFLDNDYGRLRQTVIEYHSFLSNISGFRDDSLDYLDIEETFLAGGKAISPKDATRCVLDFARTTKFLRGIYAAILEAKRRFPDQKIEILYAGCGPFATLAVPFCLKFNSDEIAFSLIDIHQRSLDLAKKIFQTLKYENFVSEYIKSDAAIYKNQKEKKFHIIITETMQKALEKEPQVAITLNLANHLLEKGIFIPQKITIEASFANMKKEIGLDRNLKPTRNRIYLGRFFELSQKRALSKSTLISPQKLEIPKGNFNELSLVMLTKVLIFEDFILDDYDSGITYPTIIHDFENNNEKSQIEFRYIMGENPHFEYKLM